jgi:hypothetical protein
MSTTFAPLVVTGLAVELAAALVVAFAEEVDEVTVAAATVVVALLLVKVVLLAGLVVGLARETVAEVVAFAGLDVC